MDFNDTKFGRPGKLEPQLEEETIPTVTHFFSQEDQDSMKFERPGKVRIIDDSDCSKTFTSTLFGVNAPTAQQFPRALLSNFQIQAVPSVFEPILIDPSEKQGSVKEKQMTLREKFGHLLPAHLAARISESHRLLLQVAAKIDQILVEILRKTSDTWIPLKRLMEKVQGREPSTIFGIIKQIQYLSPTFYLQRVEGEQIYIGLENAGNLNILQRKQSLRKQIYHFLKLKQKDYIKQSRLNPPTNRIGWAQGFDVDVEIPRVQDVVTELYFKNEDYKLETQTYISRDQFSIGSKSSSKLQAFKNKLLKKNSARQDHLQREYSQQPLPREQRVREKSIQILRSIKEISSRKKIANIFQVSLIKQVERTLKLQPLVVKLHLEELVSSQSCLSKQKVYGHSIIKVSAD